MQIELINDDHSCPNCYYEWFDDKAYPCSRCIHNKPSEDMFRPKLRAEQTENCSEKPNNCEDEPQTDIHDLTDCDFCKERNCKDCEGGKDEPQTDCGDFADRLAYERGVKKAWEVAQKVFDSTVTFYEAERYEPKGEE